jgi:hypothetical protein
MHVKKTFLSLAVAAVAASFVAVPAASASETASCTFTGLAGNIAPAIPAAPATGGTGTYDFGGNAASCTYVNTATGVVVPSTTAVIKSTGRFENDVCGTGRAFGNGSDRPVGTTGPGTYIDFADPRIPDIHQVDYRIDFVGGVGALRGGSLTTKDGSSTPGTINGAGDWRATGEIDIRPAVPGGCVTSPVAAFDVTGNFHAAR